MTRWSIFKLSFEGCNLPNLAVPLQTARPPGNAQASHQQGNIVFLKINFFISTPYPKKTKNIWDKWLPSRKRCLWMLESTVCPRMRDLTLRRQPGRSRSLSGNSFSEWNPPLSLFNFLLVHENLYSYILLHFLSSNLQQECERVPDDVRRLLHDQGGVQTDVWPHTLWQGLFFVYVRPLPSILLYHFSLKRYKVFTKMLLLRFETNLAAEATSRRSMTKSTRRLGQVGDKKKKLSFIKCCTFFVSFHSSKLRNTFNIMQLIFFC